MSRERREVQSLGRKMRTGSVGLGQGGGNVLGYTEELAVTAGDPEESFDTPAFRHTQHHHLVRTASGFVAMESQNKEKESQASAQQQLKR